MILKQKATQTTNHHLWFVITSQTTFVISKRAHYWYHTSGSGPGRAATLIFRHSAAHLSALHTTTIQQQEECQTFPCLLCMKAGIKKI
jgi:hypothetical protein